MEINIKKPNRKSIRTKARAVIPAYVNQSPLKEKVIHTDKTNSNRPLSPTHQSPLKLDINNQKSIEKNDDTISKISSEKEERLLNLIVNTLVRATLDQLYGKESN